MSHKLHNPKSHAPSIFIPAWLSQIPIKLLSLGAKMLYGRLSQWSSSNGIAFRSIPQLSQEIGCASRTIEKYLNELKKANLIGTYHPQAGGVNYYEFYDHEWMHLPIVNELCYQNDPPPRDAVPTARGCGTLPHGDADINKKEIKENNTTTGEQSAVALDDGIFIKTLKKYEIRTPAKMNGRLRSYLHTAIELLSKNGYTLDDYLNYLSNRCSRALLPYITNGVERQNGFGNILRPSFINNVLNGKWKD